jgi:hypothetical protein
MRSIAVPGYMSLEEAVDAIGRRLMPRTWLGPEVGLLEIDKHVAEELEVQAAEAGGAGTPLGRLNRAVNYLLRALLAGEVEAVIFDEHGRSHDVPAPLWGRPEVRVVFRPGEVPDEFRVAVEGHKIGEGSRWLRVSHLDIDRMLTELAAGPEVTDVAGEFRAWLAAKLRERAEGKPVFQNETWAQAQRAFADRMPFHAFERIWTETVPEEWRHKERVRRAKPA